MRGLKPICRNAHTSRWIATSSGGGGLTEVYQPAYCGQCGSLAQAGDTFCGVCGARIPPDAQEASPTKQIPTLVPLPPSVPSRGRNRKLTSGVMVGALLFLLLVGAGALALTGFGSGADLLGGVGEDAAPPGTPNTPGGSSVSPDAPPHPAFDTLLPKLREMTDVPIMLPAKLPDELDKPAIDRYGSENRREYGIVFPFGPTETVTSVSKAETLAILRAYPKEEDVASEYFDAEKIEKVGLPDGTEATLRYMAPAGRTGSQGPYWEGKFDKDGYTYVLSVIKPDEITKDDVEQALSSMVRARGSEGEPATGEHTQRTTPSSVPPQSTTSASPEGTTSEASGHSTEEIEAEAQDAAGDYYRAVGVEDWAYTYDHLDADTRSRFTRQEWFLKNQWFADNGSVIYTIQSAERLGASSGVVVEVTLRLTYEDGSSSTRETYFVLEDGEWRHAFGQEEYDLFMPEASYEEFVAAQQ